MRVRRYTVTEGIDALHARAAAAVVSDDKAERIRNKSVAGCAVAAVAAALVFIGGLVARAYWSPDAMEYAGPMAFYLFVAGVVIGIGVYVWYGRYDLDDRKVTTLHKLLAVLRADVPSAAPVHVDVDFRDYRKGRLVRKDAGFWASNRSYVYAHRWLAMRVPLADGTRLHIAVVDHVKRKEKSKRKWTKVRERARSRVRLALRLGKDHADADAVVRQLKGMTPPDQMRLVGARASGRTLLVDLLSRPDGRVNSRRGGSADTPLAPCNGDTLLLALRWVYRGLARPA